MVQGTIAVSWKNRSSIPAKTNPFQLLYEQRHHKQLSDSVSLLRIVITEKHAVSTAFLVNIMRKIAGKPRDMENGDKVDAVDSEAEEQNGVEEDADPLATPDENGENEPAADENNDNASDEGEQDGDDDADDDDEEKPLKTTKKKAAKKEKKEKKAAKKAAKKKKEKKRVSLNVPDDDDDDEEEAEYEVQDIVSHRYVGKKLEYKIRWKGYSAKDDTWEAKASLNCPEIIKKYEEKQKKAPAKGGKRKAGRPPAKAAKKSRKNASDGEENDDDEEEEGDEDAEYEVAKLLDVRTRKGKREFLVHWKGWSARYDNWEPEDNLNCDELIAKFDKQQEKTKHVSAKSLRASPKSTKRLAVETSKGARSSKRGSAKSRVTYYDDE
ncbi:AT-rich interactive domain-containing protein 4A [Culicoides brevitarsis]|uniref:AT-rich interactive domain-containing protein 4A n=1 Tax=Culicoides brevitarsis TaxID=469753 RepID=UPI00307BE983